MKKHDDLYNDAIDIVRGYDKASVSLLQKELKIGNNRAAAIMEDLEAHKIVSKMKSGKREVIYDDLPVDTPKKKKKPAKPPKAPNRESKPKNAKGSKTGLPPGKRKKNVSESKNIIKKPADTTNETVPPKNTKKANSKKSPKPNKNPYKISNKQWNKEIVMEAICLQIIQTSYGLHAICKNNPEFPKQSTVYLWMNEEEKNNGETPILDMYARAKEMQADYLVDEILDICDNSTNDFMEKENKQGQKVTGIDHENIQRDKLRVDARKWIAGKLRHRKYGEKLEISGDPKRPLSKVSDEDIDKQLAVLLKQLKSD